MKDTFEEKSNYEEFFVVCKVRYMVLRFYSAPASPDRTKGSAAM